VKLREKGASNVGCTTRIESRREHKEEMKQRGKKKGNETRQKERGMNGTRKKEVI